MALSTLSVLMEEKREELNHLLDIIDELQDEVDWMEAEHNEIDEKETRDKRRRDAIQHSRSLATIYETPETLDVPADLELTDDQRQHVVAIEDRLQGLRLSCETERGRLEDDQKAFRVIAEESRELESRVRRAKTAHRKANEKHLKLEDQLRELEKEKRRIHREIRSLSRTIGGVEFKRARLEEERSNAIEPVKTMSSEEREDLLNQKVGVLRSEGEDILRQTETMQRKKNRLLDQAHQLAPWTVSKLGKNEPADDCQTEKSRIERAISVVKDQLVTTTADFETSVKRAITLERRYAALEPIVRKWRSKKLPMLDETGDNIDALLKECKKVIESSAGRQATQEKKLSGLRAKNDSLVKQLEKKKSRLRDSIEHLALRDSEMKAKTTKSQEASTERERYLVEEITNLRLKHAQKEIDGHRR